jgi:hypothetical protein
VGDVWGWLLLVGQIVVPVAALGAVLYFLVRVLRPRPRIAGSAAAPALPDSATPTAADRRTARRTAVAIAASGLVLPWVVGLAVKAWLDAVGEPTYPISGFLEPVAVVVLLAATVAQWSWPFLLLAFWVGSRHFPRLAPHHPFRTRLRLARVTHLAGLAGGVVVFIPVFRSWDTMYIFVPLGVFLLAPMLAGYGVGLLVLRRRESRPAAPN